MDPTSYPAFWGLAGGLLFGALELVTAYSQGRATELTRRRAWLRLALGCLAGPVLAEALTPTFLAVAPGLDMRTISTLVGWFAAKDPRALLEDLKNAVISALRKGNQNEPT